MARKPKSEKVKELMLSALNTMSSATSLAWELVDSLQHTVSLENDEELIRAIAMASAAKDAYEATFKACEDAGVFTVMQ